MTEAVIRRAEAADLAAIAWLRRQWTQEQQSVDEDQGFARVVLSPSERSIPFYERAGFGPAYTLMLRTSPDTTDESPRQEVST